MLTEREMPDNKRPKSVEDAFISFLEKEGIEGFVRLIEEARKHPDPIMDWICEKAAEYEREKEKAGERGTSQEDRAVPDPTQESAD